MAPIVVSIMIWLIGIIIILLGKYLYDWLMKTKEKFKEKAEGAQFHDHSKAVAFQISGKVLDAIPWYYVRLIFILVGAVIIALGFVPLGFLFI
ncbi:hypothetical protein [Tuberibacillus calidus]|uniref:hypothetical protein n=1 Tax=Tuberibacillus calidus TaxID=340097 RepID=UPI000405A5B6|nr:hypothetical protein [Tuberibacillus calidus]